MQPGGSWWHAGAATPVAPLRQSAALQPGTQLPAQPAPRASHTNRNAQEAGGQVGAAAGRAGCQVHIPRRQLHAQQALQLAAQRHLRGGGAHERCVGSWH